MFLYLPLYIYFLFHRFLLLHFFPSSSHIFISFSLFCPSTFPSPSINSPLPIFSYLFFALLCYLSTFSFPIYSSHLPSSYLLIPPSFFNSLPPLPLPIYSSWSPPPSSSAHLPYFPLLMNSSVPLPFLPLHKIIYPSSSQRPSLSSTVLPPLHLYTLSSLSESSKPQKDTTNLTYHQARQSQRDQSWPFLKRFSLSFAFPS